MDIFEIAKKTKVILQELPGSSSDCAKIEDFISQLETKCVYCSVCGEFSSGKSSLINSIIGYPLLPVADLPLTSKKIEIKHSTIPYLTCCWGNKIQRCVKNGMLEILSAIEEGTIIVSRKKLGDRIVWEAASAAVQMKYFPLDIQNIKNFLWTLEASQHCSEKQTTQEENSKIVNFISQKKENHDKIEKLSIQLQDIEIISIGIPLPETLQHICLVDIPGEGSIYTYSSNTKRATKTAQIILHVFDAEHIGSKLTEEMLVESKRENAAIIYVLNKKDTLSDSSIKDIFSLLLKKYQITPIAVSALYENCSYMISNGICSVENLLKNKKVNLSPAILSPKWDAHNTEKNKIFLAQYLHETSNCKMLAEHISSLVELNETSLLKFYKKELHEILDKNLQEMKVLIVAAETSPKKTELLGKISTTSAICRKIDDFQSDTNQKFNSLFPSKINTALNNLQKQFDTVLSDSLLLNFDKFEENLGSEVSTAFSFPISYEIKNVVDTFFAQRKNECADFIWTQALNIPVPAFSSVTWNTEVDFLKQIQEMTCSIIRPILQDTEDKPWFSLLRPRALRDYRQKKHLQCMQCWRTKIGSVFSEEKTRIVHLYRQVLRDNILPFLDLKVTLDNELKSLETCLSLLQKELTTKREHLCEIQFDLAKQIENLTHLEGSYES